MSENVKNETGVKVEPHNISNDLPHHFSPEVNQFIPIPFEDLDFSFDPSFLAVDTVYDPTLGGTRKPTGASILEPDAILDADGRTYHSYTQGSLYFLPNDGLEQDRLDFQHKIFDLLLDGNLALAPIDSPTYVLDVATGTGIWALEFAEKNPLSHVVGTDLSHIQPDGRIPNCEFIKEDAEASEWIFPYTFDYIHLRNIATCFNDSKVVFHRAFDHLTPGAWIECQDPSTEGYWIDPSYADSPVARYSALMRLGMAKVGRLGDRAPLYKTWLEEVGFVDVTERIVPCPVGEWPKDRKMKDLGRRQAQNFTDAIPSVRKIALLSGASVEEIDELAEGCVKQYLDPNNRMILNYYFVYARKPRSRRSRIPTQS